MFGIDLIWLPAMPFTWSKRQRARPRREEDEQANETELEDFFERALELQPSALTFESDDDGVMMGLGELHLHAGAGPTLLSWLRLAPA